jgi:hypothetical protein
MSKLLVTEVLSINDIIAEALKLVRKEEKQPLPECTDLLNPYPANVENMVSS